jgi:hypothetical protein
MGESRDAWPGELNERGVVESLEDADLAAPLVAATDVGARKLGARYWADVEAWSHRLLTVDEHEHGTDVLLARRVALLRFGPPRTAVLEDHIACVYEIRGGLLTAQEGGALSVEQRSGSRPGLAVVVTGYRPRLASVGRWLYLGLQAPVHRAVSRRFLERGAGGWSA